MQKVASLSQLPADRGLQVEIGETKMLLVRDGDAARAYSAECPHAGAPLAEGAICNGRIVCPWHKAVFHVADGGLKEPPALDGLGQYHVKIDGDDIWVDPTPLPAATPGPSETPDPRVFALVGAGAAGGTAAAALREFGFAGRVILIGKEPTLPFDRTSISKFVLSGEMKPEEIPLLRSQDFYAERQIELIEDEVTRLDVRTREIELAGGRTIAFDQALIATGGQPIRLDIPGADKTGVHVLRSLEDAAGILKELKPGGHAIILGASFIGLEAASCLRAQKVQVTVVSPEDIPFVKQFGERIGKSIRTLHQNNGVTFVGNAEAAALEGDTKVTTVKLKDGRCLSADLVIMGVGVRPATEFVQGVDRAKDGGLPVDANLRVSEGLYAAGDIAAFPLTRDQKPTRIEHWRVAQQQARIAAANMLGHEAAYAGVPFFWTYHYGQTFEYLGHAQTWDDEIIVGDVEKQNFAALLLQQDEVAAVVACGRQRLTAALAERMKAPLLRDEALRMIERLSEE